MTVPSAEQNGSQNSSNSRYIMTLGSHCSLQVLKGAKDEGFHTLLICEEKRLSLYKRFKFIDKLIVLDNFKDILNTEFQKNLVDEFDPILIPHGTLISSISMNDIEKIEIPIFGNKFILRWESDRVLKQRLMNESLLSSPEQIMSKDDIKGLCIVKLHGAAGGKGYFLVTDKKGFEVQSQKLIESGMSNLKTNFLYRNMLMEFRFICNFFILHLKMNWNYWVLIDVMKLI